MLIPDFLFARMIRVTRRHGLDVIDQAGLAMTTGSFKRLSELRHSECNAVWDAFLRYCELGEIFLTMSFVGLFERDGRPLCFELAN